MEGTVGKSSWPIGGKYKEREREGMVLVDYCVWVWFSILGPFVLMGRAGKMQCEQWEKLGTLFWMC